MTYSLCFSRPRFFRGKTTGSRQTVERTPTSSGGILFTTRRRSAPMNCEVVMKLLWHMLWDLSSNFQKKIQMFSQLPTLVKMTHSQQWPWKIFHESPILKPASHDSLLLTATNPGRDHAKASVQTHISSWIISKRPKPRLCINLEDKVITINYIYHIYIYILCVYNMYIYIYLTKD